MEEALRAAEREDSVFARRVRLAKLSWDHARLLAWTEWGTPGSPAAEARNFRQTIDAFGIDSYRETTKRQTLVDYLHGPIANLEQGCDL